MPHPRAAGASRPHDRPRAALIERLRRATCPATMLEALRRDWPYPEQRGMRLAECRIDRVHRVGETGFVIDYEMRLEGNYGERVERVFGELDVDGKAEHRSEQILKRLRNKRRGQISQKTFTNLVAPLPDPGLVLRFADLDERLYGLKLRYDPKTAMALLSRYAAAESEVRTVAVEVLGHRLRKRCVVRFGCESSSGAAQGGSIIAKMYKFHSDQGHKVKEVMERLCRNGFGKDSDIRIPEPLAYLPDLRVILMEDVSSVPVSCLVNVESVIGVAAAGRALAKVHGCPLRVAARHTVADEIALLEQRVGLVCEVDPSLGVAMAEALAAVRSELARCRGVEPTLVHRDFYEKQVLVDEAKTVLIDFDTLCLGDPALDLGNFLAHLRLAELQGTVGEEPLKEAFLAGYGARISAALGRRIEAYTKSTLLRLACLYSFSTRWRHLAEPLLEGAR